MTHRISHLCITPEMQREMENFRGQFSRLVRSLEDRVDDLVAQAKIDRQLQTQPHTVDSGSVWTAKQNSLSSLKTDWLRVKNLAKCLDRQMEHQANYHIFYQTLKEYQTALEATFAGFRVEVTQQGVSGSKEEAKWLFDQIQKLVTSVLQWWQRIDTLIIQSRKVLPMHVRLGPLDMKRPGKVLVDFEAQGLTLKANDDVFVVDTNDRDLWTVETTRGREVTLPSMCIAICGPDPEVMERALSARTQLLTQWTATLREVGRALVSFVLKVFRKTNTAELSTSSEAASLDALDLQPLLSIMEKLLQTYWTNHPEFADMADRIRKTRVSLAIYQHPEEIDDYTHIDFNTLFLQLSPMAMSSGSQPDESMRDNQVTQKMLTLLMRKYQELLKYWEVYKVLVETSNDPNYYWMMEEFQKLRYINVTELLNFLASEDKESWLQYIQQLMSRPGRKPAGAALSPETLEEDLDLRPDDLRLGDAPSARVLIDAADSSTFVQTVRLPQVGGEVTAELINADLHNHANGLDTVDSRQQSFVSIATLNINATEPELELEPEPEPEPEPESEPEPAAPVKTAEIEEFKRDEVEHSARMMISGVIDTLENSTLSMQEAIDRGIIHSESGSYLNRAKNVWIPIPVAMSEGLIMVERQTEEQRQVKQQQVYGIVTIRSGGGGGSGPAFAVTAVHDRLRRSKLTPAEAQREGLANESLTSFFDAERGEWLATVEAAERGIVEYDVAPAGSGGTGDGIEDSVSYVVYSVVDVKEKTSVSFKESCEMGLIDTGEGIFVNSKTGERMEFDDAMKKGFLKADRVTGPVSQVAGAEQRVVVNRFKSARSRMQGALAFQGKAARAAKGFGGSG